MFWSTAWWDYLSCSSNRMFKNVSCNLQLVCSFPCIMVMHFFVVFVFCFILLLLFGVRSILSKWKLNTGIFSIHWNALPALSYVFYFIIFLCVFVIFTCFSNIHAPTLVSAIFVEAGLWHGTLHHWKREEKSQQANLKAKLRCYFVPSLLYTGTRFRFFFSCLGSQAMGKDGDNKASHPLD